MIFNILYALGILGIFALLWNITEPLATIFIGIPIVILLGAILFKNWEQ